MSSLTSRRRFLKHLGVSAATLPFALNLPSLGLAGSAARKQRLIVMFSPNGTIPAAFWPDQEGSDFELKPILKPLEPFHDKLLVLNGVCDRVRGDGDSHMRGIGCLLTGIELFPGNIQGGSHTPAGWSTGISLDQELKNFFQANPESRTRFGSLEFGVQVPDRADTWTRMSYSGPNQPVAPIDNPYQMFEKLYGRIQDRETLGSVLDDLLVDLEKLQTVLSAEDRRLLEEHTTFVREMEQELKATPADDRTHAVPEIEQGIREDNDNIPQISRTQIDLLVNSFTNDFARVATLQYTNSVGQARMRWLGIEEGHHTLSHEEDDNAQAQEQLTKINTWFCEQLAYLVKRLAESPEPGGTGSLLDNTQIVWGNELGKGNSHTLDNIPFVLVGGGSNFQTGRSLKFDRVPHNRLLMSLAHSFGHHVPSFGNADFCADGPLTGLS